MRGISSYDPLLRASVVCVFCRVSCFQLLTKVCYRQGLVLSTLDCLAPHHTPTFPTIDLQETVLYTGQAEKFRGETVGLRAFSSWIWNTVERLSVTKLALIDSILGAAVFPCSCK